ncbi:MAG: diacylglycerol kinase family lipid kinase [Deltaproteobacteria bacterium]|nr:diacylglycerol kinase family lipid kinase [Deltaproteobacteria bacterium]
MANDFWKRKIIINPQAGGGRARKLFPLLREKLLKRGLSFHLQFSESGEHVTELVRHALREGYDQIVSCGGDGTAHRVIQPIVGGRAVLALIPLGRGNDLCRDLGIGGDIDAACDLLQHGKVRKIDVIQVDSGPYLMGVGGVGFDSEVNALSDRLRRFLGEKAGYLLPVLLKTLTYRTKQVDLQANGDSRRGPMLLVAFGNTRSCGMGMQITPLSEPDDGLLDVCWIDPVKKLRLLCFFPTVFSGEHLDLEEVHYFQADAVRVESPVPMNLYGDGEFLGRTPFTLRVRPQALRVLVP